MPYHHRIDIKPVPDNVFFVNEPWIADPTLGSLMEDRFRLEDTIDPAEDNIRVYVPLDINRESVMRQLYAIIQKYGEANEGNEFYFESEVSKLISRIEIYDQIHFVRGSMEGTHSEEGRALVREFVSELKNIPDGCAEMFPFSMIDELEAEYEI